ncbi:hypothetical protein HBI17_002010 [Parastagonospora nodorum]|nr:hypothetical protein HBH96_042610 [Parastagonospora nodorum]KAH5125487.1 hypothetical protein HBH71_007440 [Parastagonospora nodorum]KAH5660059.1 hypothetical protein HBI51_007510 [Parastagonospora nodorum]KAH5773808.1 hypothetical protein HBI17_002010 [Parastagonospora nodorum]KAH6006699.1 hypothetical protein HBI84_064790 [Parastagonospora nodorum]
MRDAKLVLSLQQIETITSFSYDLRRSYGCKRLHSYENSNIIANAILLFPNLERFEIRILRGRKTSEDVHCSYDPQEHEHGHAGAVRKHVPHWFHSIIDNVTKGCAYKWQTGEHWMAEWPQLEDGEYFETAEDYDLSGSTQIAPFMSPDAVGKVRGVQKCPCRCGNVVWTSANIIQETGRMIKIDSVFYGPEDRVCTDAKLEASILARLAPETIVLQEGDHPLNLAPGFRLDDKMTATSYAWDADRQYWDDLRRRNGDWKAFCKLAWQLTTSITHEEQFPGSRARNEGDWPIMTEMAKVKHDPAAGDGGGVDQAADG